MNDALFEFLRDVYNDTNKMALTNEEIKNIEEFYKENYKDIETFEEFMKLDTTISKNIKKVKGIYAEVERQFSNQKALQPGTLVECTLAQTIADMYNLDCFVDAFHSYIRELPANVVPFLRSEDNQLLCRYIYYDPNNYENFLIQYGNPTSYDADLFIHNQNVKIEIKDRIARAGERDIRSYDENGKLIIDEKFKNENPDFVPLLEKFNEETDVFSRYEKSTDEDKINYRFDDEKMRTELVKAYFRNLGFDTLVTFDENNELIAITLDCLEEKTDLKIVSTDGSEIRPAGKNPGDVFTPIYMKKLIHKKKGLIDEEYVKLSKDEMKDRIARGKNKEVTGKKIGSLFFVDIEKIKEDNNSYVFKISDIQQLKPNIAPHIQIIVSKSQLREYYYEILDSYSQDKDN